MTATVALLRAVNVGGRSIRMADLVALFADLGFPGARTHLQSGNVIFDSGKADRGKVSATIEAGIAERFGFRSEAILRTGAELARLIAGNPFPEMAQDDPAHLLVMFLAYAPTREDKTALAMEWGGPETWQLVGHDLFICYPAGIGKSRLKLKLKAPGTGRNWNVVNALAEMAKV